MGHLIIILLVNIIFIVPSLSHATANKQAEPSGALLRSMILPGWGHYHIDKENWNRGKIHLGTEAILIASYFGLVHRASNLEKRYITHASLKAGVHIQNRSRSFHLAIGDYSDLNAYNDYQLRSRNWNRLFEDTEENRWNWKSEDDRQRYNQLRSDRDRIRNQLPGIIGLMALNRVVSAVSSFQRARNASIMPDIAILPVADHQVLSGAVFYIGISF